jgi:hypothetical protein
MQHNWVPSTLGHGETMRSRCWITNREAAVLGCMNECDAPPPKPANTNLDQEAIDSEMLGHEDDDEDDDLSAECGRWNNGRLTRQCRLAGTEWCDWDCPIGC